MRSRLLKMEDEACFTEDLFGCLPEGFVAKALSLTSPRDACRLSLVSSLFRSAADWDAVWESFLPPDYQKIVAEAEDGGCSLSFSSKKQLFLRLCDHPLIIDGGNKSFSLDKETGKKCYMLGARDLSIVWGDTPRYWRWISSPESRFSEVAELVSVCWLEVHGRISTSMLSPNTTYAAFIVFKSTSETYGFEYQPAEVSIGISGLQTHTHTVILEPQPESQTTTRLLYPVVPRRRLMFHRRHLIPNPLLVPLITNSTSTTTTSSSSTKGNGGPKHRKDGWLEIQLGEYYIDKPGGQGGDLEMSMTEVKGGNWKGGLLIQGIEIRPNPNPNPILPPSL